jgi:hypothetical protein
MGSIPWKDLIDFLRFAMWILLAINIINLFKALIVEVFSRNCRHCGKRV